MSDHGSVALPGSSPVVPREAVPAGVPDLSQTITISIYLKPRSRLQTLALPEGQGAKLARLQAIRADEYAGDIQQLRDFAAQHTLIVEAVEPVRRLVKLSGTAARMQAAFGITLSLHHYRGTTFHSHAGPLQVPADLAPSIEAILGFDTRPIAHASASLVADSLSAHLPNQVAKLYGFPADYDGTGQCIGIIELGGGYLASDNTAAFAAMGLPVPSIVAVSVDGGFNNPDDSQSYSEVVGDIQICGGTAPGARIAVYFAPNTSQYFINAVTQAATDTVNQPSILSISRGGAEVDWASSGIQTMTAMNTALQEAAGLGLSVFAAAGDHLAIDLPNNGKANVQFPASSPWIIGCGGTQIDTTGDTITGEVVWNDGATGWGTGGGISDYFDVPPFQANTSLPPSVNGGRVGRGVPDVAGNAASASPYQVVIRGENWAWNGTSGVAPLWAGLAARLNQAVGLPIGFFLTQMYDQPPPLREILQGNNKPVGSQLGYDAGPNWNACTGLGVPTAGLLAYFARPATPTSKLAVINYPGPEVRLYYQDVTGAIQEYCLSAGVWQSGATLGVAASGSGLAAVSWTAGDNVHIRVYYQTTTNAIQEYCWDGSASEHKWVAGELLAAATPGSALAALVWQDSDLHLRVYYQIVSDAVQEYCWDGRWSTGISLPYAMAGTKIAVATWLPVGSAHTRLYYQNTLLTISEYCNDGTGWVSGTTLPAAIAGSALSAVAWQGGGLVHICLFFQLANGMLAEDFYNGSYWQLGDFSQPAITGGSLAATLWNPDQPSIRVYYRSSYILIQESCWSGAWTTGACSLRAV